jgi:hypothetical protein
LTAPTAKEEEKKKMAAIRIKPHWLRQAGRKK